MRIITIGAGMSGLTASYKLINQHEILVLEKEEEVGGLAKSINYMGYIWDIGPHRFYTDDKEILEFVRKLVLMHSCKRSSSIYMFDEYHNYPIQFESIKKLGFFKSMKCMLSYLWARTKGPREKNLEEWIVSRFGWELYDLYFYEYTKKIWGLEPKMISSIWAKKRIPVPGFGVLINSLLFGKDTTPALDREFIYPSHGKGVQHICKVLREQIHKKGGEVRVNEGVISIKYHNNEWEVKTDRGTYNADYLISSIALTDLPYMLDAPEAIKKYADQLRYRSLVCIFLVLNENKISDNHWIYFPQSDLPYMRLSQPKNFDPELGFKGRTHFCVEFPCFYNDRIWNADDNVLVDIFIKTAPQIGIKGKLSNIFCVKRIKYAYPIYNLNYERKVSAILKYLENFPITQIGRNGAFQYGNMADSIKMGFDCADKVNNIGSD